MLKFVPLAEASAAGACATAKATGASRAGRADLTVNGGGYIEVAGSALATGAAATAAAAEAAGATLTAGPAVTAVTEGRKKLTEAAIAA